MRDRDRDHRDRDRVEHDVAEVKRQGTAHVLVFVLCLGDAMRSSVGAMLGSSDREVFDAAMRMGRAEGYLGSTSHTIGQR
jgi:hypothetical protein